MKITIDNLQNQDLLSEVDSFNGNRVVGGDSIDASVDIFATSDNASARATAKVVGFGSNLFGNVAATGKTGNGFSRSSSLAFIRSI
jgi:hypothetical protein